MINFTRKIIAVVFFMLARLLKIICIAVAPADLKEGFRDNV